MASDKFDYAGMQATATDLIGFFGMDALLRRGGVDRPCTACVYDYAPRNMETSLALPIERRVFIAATTGALTQAPDYDQDQLVTFVQPPANPPVVDEILNFASPAKKYAPAGLLVAYELVVRR